MRKRGLEKRPEFAGRNDLTDPENLTDQDKLVGACRARRAPSATRSDPWRSGKSVSIPPPSSEMPALPPSPLLLRVPDDVVVGVRLGVRTGAPQPVVVAVA